MITKNKIKNLSIFILGIFFIEAKAQQKDFAVNGKTVGSHLFNYAYAYNNESKLISKAKITNGTFILSGKYEEKQRFDEPPFLTIILLVNDDDSNRQNFSKRSHNEVKVMLGEPVDLIYESDKKHFNVKGGPLNKIGQEFQDVYWEYRYKRDSTFAQIDKMEGSDWEKHDQRALTESTLFSIAVNKTIPILLKSPTSEIALFNFGPVVYHQTIPSDVVLEIFNNFSISIKNSKYGKHVLKGVQDKISQEEYLNNPAFTVGMTIPKFELPDQHSKWIKSDTKYGKYTLIDFWATWCTPCRNETPNLLAALKNYQQKGLEIITVSVDVKADLSIWQNALKQDKMEVFTNLIDDPKSKFVREMKVSALPSNYLIDQHGKIISVNLRGKELQDKLKTLMP